MEYVLSHLEQGLSFGIAVLIYLYHNLLMSEVWCSLGNEDGIFWVVTLRGLVGGYHHFLGPYCLHLQVDVSQAWRHNSEYLL
jgi:hypothetical protein